MFINSIFPSFLPFLPSGVPTIHDKGLVDFNGSFSYGALVNNDGVAPAPPPITLEEPPVRSRSTDSSAGENDLKRDWSSIFEVCLERPLGFLCQFCWPRPCPATLGFSGWWVSKMLSHSALHPFYLKSLNQSVTCGTFSYLRRCWLCSEETRHPNVWMWPE